MIYIAAKYFGQKWIVRQYYAEHVQPPRAPRTLALETVHANDTSKDLEVIAAEYDSSIGTIVVLDPAQASIAAPVIA